MHGSAARLKGEHKVRPYANVGVEAMLVIAQWSLLPRTDT
jgi:hypothetical protein